MIADVSVLMHSVTNIKTVVRTCEPSTLVCHDYVHNCSQMPYACTTIVANTFSFFYFTFLTTREDNKGWVVPGLVSDG